jgi:DNA-binding transcriptional ArsR family regulator
VVRAAHAQSSPEEVEIEKEGKVKALDQTFAALSDPTRRGVIDLLRRKPRRAGELAEELQMSAPAMSRHLRVLRKSGLVEEELGDEDARVRVYTLKKEPFRALRRWLDDVEQFWALELASFKEHVEKTRPRK